MIGGGRHHAFKGEVTKAKAAGVTLRKFMVYLKPYKFRLVLVVLLIIISSLLTVASPIVIKDAVDLLDDYLNNFISQNKAFIDITYLMIFLFLIFLAVWITNVLSLNLMIKISQDILYVFRKNIFSKITFIRII